MDNIFFAVCLTTDSCPKCKTFREIYTKPILELDNLKTKIINALLPHQDQQKQKRIVNIHYSNAEKAVIDAQEFKLFRDEEHGILLKWEKLDTYPDVSEMKVFAPFLPAWFFVAGSVWYRRCNPHLFPTNKKKLYAVVPGGWIVVSHKREDGEHFYYVKPEDINNLNFEYDLGKEFNKFVLNPKTAEDCPFIDIPQSSRLITNEEYGYTFIPENAIEWRLTCGV